MVYKIINSSMRRSYQGGFDIGYSQEKLTTICRVEVNEYIDEVILPEYAIPKIRPM
ncbi:hypothetical protein ACFC4I_13000 [Enterococcus durans]|uniref:hypothetical protein n=1 Tax=Enterococcus durans TaxID=53345 RepID=UPI0026C2EDAD